MQKAHLAEEDTNFLLMTRMDEEYAEEASLYGDPLEYLIALEEQAERANAMTLRTQPSNI